jgi:hypothetical protein
MRAAIRILWAPLGSNRPILGVHTANDFNTPFGVLHGERETLVQKDDGWVCTDFAELERHKSNDDR